MSTRRRTSAKAYAKDVSVNQERKLGLQRRLGNVVVLALNNTSLDSSCVAPMTMSVSCEKSDLMGSGGSMVARLKLKEIDGRAPQGVEPVAQFNPTRGILLA